MEQNKSKFLLYSRDDKRSHDEKREVSGLPSCDPSMAASLLKFVTARAIAALVSSRSPWLAQ